MIMTVYVVIKEDGTIVVRDYEDIEVSATAYEIEDTDEALINLIQTLRG